MSAGHGSMLVYAIHHLLGYADMGADQLRAFRQLGSRTAGHPEYGHALGDRDHHRPAGPGNRHRRRHGAGRADAERTLRRRPGRSLHLRHGRGRLPDGGDQPRGDRPGRASGPWPVDRHVGRQPHHHRRLDGPVDLDGPAGAVQGGGLARAVDRRPRPRGDRGRNRGRAGRHPTPLDDRLPHHHRQGRAQHGRQSQGPRRAAGRRGDRRRPCGAGLAARALRRAQGRARRLEDRCRPRGVGTGRLERTQAQERPRRRL